ncbi:arylamine N-acetyltransferase [Streptomyces sp. SID10815]|uniref:arylamine N-acetyltransferase family protein n=1 Tax=Streptomyces sp. SID10815 TaxID=2706027 RepID=UPI0013C66F73|nr:arylamine N-acetyltransferase [Streptomyces sp. SID10815]NEA49768.1 arylamine N-acetyltransferase [Streptomyces sp. SID10815]
MFEVETYLRRLGFTEVPEPDIETLRRLHKNHLMTLPYDSSHFVNSFTGFRNVVDIDVDAAFRAIVGGGAGGVCHDLSGLFRRLLAELGYDVSILAASQRWPDGRFGPDFEHTFTGVRLDGATWLVDVGFAGPSYLEPLRMTDEVQHQYGCAYRLTADGAHHVLERRAATGDWRSVYRFELTARAVSDWDSPRDTAAEQIVNDSLFAKTVLRGRATGNGQLVLTGRRLLTVEEGRETTRTLIDKAEFEGVVKTILAGSGNG